MSRRGQARTIPAENAVLSDCRFKNQWWCLDVSSHFYLKQASKSLKTSFDLEKKDAVSLARPSDRPLPAVLTLHVAGMRRRVLTGVFPAVGHVPDHVDSLWPGVENLDLAS